MKLKQNIFEKYNHPDVVAVVSPYPKKGEVYSAGTTGVASYSKNVVRGFSRKALVLTDYKAVKEAYEEDNTLVMRCYRKNSATMWFAVYKRLRKFKQIKTVLVHFDFSMYGSFTTAGQIIPFLFLLKLAGYKVSVVSHSVILDVNKLSGHVGLTNSLLDRVKAVGYNSVFRLFYYLLGLTASNIIVLEKKLKDRLGRVVDNSKIQAIPHGVDATLATVSKEKARKQLGIGSNEQVVLFFGFVNWFKGADFFAETFDNITKLLNKPARFIMAGGKSPTLNDKTYYRDYFAKVDRLVKKAKNIEITGYVPQEKIKLYFAAADLVVFPYRDFMCASGVLSLTFSYQKPFIVSSELAKMLDARDFKQALRQVGLAKSDMVFSLEQADLLNQTTNVLADGLKPKLEELTKIISEQRSFAKTAILYEDALFATTTAVSGSLALEVSQAYGK